jgi:hypothetical protein
MVKKKSKCCENLFTKGKGKEICTSQGCGGCAYFLGFVGAAIYYISTATGFWMGVWGVVKALVWPAILVYKFLGM